MTEVYPGSLPDAFCHCPVPVNSLRDNNNRLVVLFRKWVMGKNHPYIGKLCSPRKITATWYAISLRSQK